MTNESAMTKTFGDMTIFRINESAMTKTCRDMTVFIIHESEMTKTFRDTTILTIVMMRKTFANTSCYHCVSYFGMSWLFELVRHLAASMNNEWLCYFQQSTCYYY